MDYFINNSIILAYVFSVLFFSGLGIGLLLLPRYKCRDVFLLAPVIGMSLIALIGLFQITVLLVPLTPKITIGCLVALSFIICFWTKRNHFKKAWYKFRYYWLIIITPALGMLFIFAWIFHNDGFYLLVGSSDQLQYTENARQIGEEMHKGTPYDVPVARQNYYVYEVNTRIMPYQKTYRRGAEVILASIKAITKLSYGDIFPVIIFCALVTISLVATFICRNFFRFTLFACLMTQLLFLSSFYFLVLHIQGSLALTLSIAPQLASLAVFSYIIRRFSWKWLFLEIILLGGYLAIYVEPVLITLIIPCLVLIALALMKSKETGYIFLARIILLCSFIFMIIPFSMLAIFDAMSANISAFNSQLLSHLTHSTTSTLANSHSAFMWNPISVLLGLVSYYDNSAFNYHVSSFLGSMPRINEVIFLTLGVFALLGFMRIKNHVSLYCTYILIMWVLFSLILSYTHDPLRMIRSVQYVMPFILLGLMILSFGYRFHKSKEGNLVITWIGRILVIGFIFFNISTSARTISYITSHNMQNDSILIHYSESSSIWKNLQNELHTSAIHYAPVLFAGFKETIRPFIISIAIRDQPHFLGNSISQFWIIYTIFHNVSDDSALCFTNPSFKHQILLTKWKHSDLYDVEKYFFKNFPITSLNESNNILADPLIGFLNSEINFKLNEVKMFPIKFFNTKVDSNLFKIFQTTQYQSWRSLEPQLLKLSQQAVVPVGFGYPDEWIDTKDVYAPKVKRFPNMCDVVYRRDYVVTLNENIVSHLMQDTMGPYRRIIKSGNILVRGSIDSGRQLSLIYEGNHNDIALKVGDRLIDGKLMPESKQIKIEANVSPEEVNSIELVVRKPVKLRSMEWISTVI